MNMCETNLTCYNCGKKLKGKQTKYCSKNCQIKFRRCYNCGKTIVKAHFKCQIYTDLVNNQNLLLNNPEYTLVNVNTLTERLLNNLWFSKHIRLLCCTCLKLPYIKKSLGLI